MKTKATAIFNARTVVADAEAGRLSQSQLRKAIQKAEKLNSRETLLRLRAIEQRIAGQRSTQRLTNDHAKGTAAWAYAELGAVPKTPYSWAALDGQGHVVINLWDDRAGWAQDSQGRWCPAFPYGARRNPERESVQQHRKLATRQEFFRLLEVAVAAHGGVVRAVISTAVDIDAIPRERLKGSSRPWLNEDNSPVALKIKDLVLGKSTFSYELADPVNRPHSPFDSY